MSRLKLRPGAYRSGEIRRRAINGGDRELRRTSVRFGEDFRALRLRAGVSQAAVARGIGVDRAVICRIEKGDPEVASFIRSRAAALLGAEFRMHLYPSSAPLIRDAAQAAIVEIILAARNTRWRAVVEAPVPGPGNRSSDLRLQSGGDVVLMEIESRVISFEENVRELQAKRIAVREALGEEVRVHVVLVLPPTRHHASLARTHPASLRAAFPVPSQDLWRALTSEEDPWPGDGLMWAPGKRS